MRAVDGAVRLSVVVPAYNEAAHLEATLRSLAAQDFSGGYEVIVVDNASTDGTAALARRHGVRVVPEPRPGVCAARQRGTLAARGDIVVSTDADTSHPPDWLSRVDAHFRAHPDVVAVAGPCRYADPPWWAVVLPRLAFASVAALAAVSGRVAYLTATNTAFRRTAFPGYDLSLPQGGDEWDFRRRLQQRGRILWDGRLTVTTSSRRLDQGLPYTLLVSFGYHYGLGYLANRLAGRTVLGVAPAIRAENAAASRRRRRRWRAGTVVVALGLVTVARVRSVVGRPG